MAWPARGLAAPLAAPSLIDLLSRASPPYPLPGPSIAAALAALGPERMPIHRQRIADLIAERDRLAGLLTGADGVSSVRAGGNFLFLEVADPDLLARRLASAGVRVRFRPNAAPGGVRVTVGTPDENEALLAVFGLSRSTTGRRAALVRDTRETQIAVSVDLDRDGPRSIDSGIAFYDHMLDQVASHGGFALTLACSGDTHIDAHHSIEDVAIALGAALRQALGDKQGIGRFGFALPMDEAEGQVLIDLSGRPFARFDGQFRQRESRRSSDPDGAPHLPQPGRCDGRGDPCPRRRARMTTTRSRRRSRHSAARFGRRSR